jgi:hypothetical protein
MHEQRIAACSVEALHEPTPALIPSTGGERDLPAIVPPTARCLDLHANETIAKISHQVVVRALEEGLAHDRSGAR